MASMITYSVNECNNIRSICKPMMKANHISDIVTQSLFIGQYTYTIYKKTSNIFFLTIKYLNLKVENQCHRIRTEAPQNLSSKKFSFNFGSSYSGV